MVNRLKGFCRIINDDIEFFFASVLAQFAADIWNLSRAGDLGMLYVTLVHTWSLTTLLLNRYEMQLLGSYIYV